jgi:hypothetical protein
MTRSLRFLVVTACASSPSIVGTVDGRSFAAHDAYFDIGTHFKVGTQIATTFTEIRFFDYAGSCQNPATAPSPAIQAGAAVYTGDPLADITSSVDLSVHAPGTFPLARSTGDQAFANWVVTAGSSGSSQNFDSGQIVFTHVSDSELAGTIEWSSTAGDHVSGSFNIPHCATADWAH